MQSLQTRKWKPRIIGIVLFVLLLAVIAVLYMLFFDKKEHIARDKKVQNNTQSKKTTSEKIRLIASGDELPHDSINQQAKINNGYDYTQFFTNVKPVFDKADIKFCNQEVPSAATSASQISGYPTFNAPVEFPRDLSNVGCNVINVATNHTNDKSQAGINTTLGEWDKLPKLAIAGANRSTEEQQKVRYFTVKGVKFAFLAYNYESNDKNLTNYGVNMFDEGLMSRQLAEAKQQGAYTLVSVHWGTEDSPDIDASQEKWAQFLANNGADVVIGTGPHVLEPVKKLPKKDGGETLVWYSVGNMLNTQLDIGGLIGGFAVMDFKIENNTPVLDTASFLPTYMHYEWTPAQKASEDLMARKNIKIYLLDSAAEAMAKSQNNTTVEAQTDRVTKTLNTYTKIPVITSKQY